MRQCVADYLEEWLGELEAAAADARERDELEPDLDTTQLVFELDAMLLAANNFYLLTGTTESLTRARRGIDRRLADSADQGGRR